jgi:hypothetical protein
MLIAIHLFRMEGMEWGRKGEEQEECMAEIQRLNIGIILKLELGKKIDG